MERTLIAWNLPNIITICLMAAFGYVVVAIVAQVFQNGLPVIGASSNDNALQMAA